MSPSFDFVTWMQATFGESSRLFFDFFSTFGGPYGWLITMPLVFWLGGSKAGLRVAFPVTLAMIGNTLLKWALATPRPYYVTDEVRAMKATNGLGMPSGHAQGVAAQWLTLAYFLRQSWCSWLAVVFILSTGASRVYLGLHTPGQVAVGWILGVLTVVVTVWLEDPIVEWLRQKPIAVQVASSLGVGAVIILIGLGIALGLRGEFNAPPEWGIHWQATVDRLVAEGDQTAGKAEFKLMQPIQIVGMGCLFIGVSLCGLWILRNGEINPKSETHRLLNVVLGLPLLTLTTFVLVPQLESIIGTAFSLALIGITAPFLVGVVLPKLTSRLCSSP